MRRRRRAVACATVVVAVAVGGSSGAGVAHADAAFSLSVNTTGVSVVAFNQTFPLVESLQVSAPSATASLNSRGEATAYSASPDPGQDASELPAVLAGALCTTAPLPDCPTITTALPRYPTAYAQTGNPPQDVMLPGDHLHAEATSTSSVGQSTIGVAGATNATATARTLANPDGSLVATADSDVEALDLATYLQLSGVHSTASLQRSSGGTLGLDSSFTVGGLTVGGQTFGFRDGSFDLLGTLVPAPVPVQTVLDALKAVGVQGRFLPADKTANGITSAGLSLSYQAPAPPSGVIPPLPGLPLPIGIGLPSGPTTVTYTIGRVSTSGIYKLLPSTSGTVGGIVGGTLTGPTTPASSAPAVSSSAPVPTATTGEPATLGSVPSGTSTGAAPITPGTPVVAPPQPAAVGVTTVAARQPVSTDPTDIYLALVVAAFAAFGGATAIRFLGVRRTWTS